MRRMKNKICIALLVALSRTLLCMAQANVHYYDFVVSSFITMFIYDACLHVS